MRRLRLREAKLLNQGHTANKLAFNHKPLGVKKPRLAQPWSTTVMLRRDRRWVSVYGLKACGKDYCGVGGR